MSSAARFRCWTITVLVLTIGQSFALLAASFAHPTPSQIKIGIALFEIPVVVLLPLLITTPADAIRLSPRRTMVIVLLGTALLHGLAFALLTPRQPAITVIVFGATSIAAASLQSVGRSAWWVVVIAWNPVLLALPIFI